MYVCVCVGAHFLFRGVVQEDAVWLLADRHSRERNNKEGKHAHTSIYPLYIYIQVPIDIYIYIEGYMGIYIYTHTTHASNPHLAKVHVTK